ncbi:hypothetical protein [Rhizobium sp.]|jgi:choline dehydrogenase-like flavoprotein|uniref:hypothetical protein n=1 Tax=Rhizobium sp. TaxID=391 RepID=UPI002AA600A0
MKAAWPVSYDEFEPYYAVAERLMGTHGTAGLDPTEPPRSGPCPTPRLAMNIQAHNYQKLFDLTGWKAIVTGGSRGIGQALAQVLAADGADLQRMPKRLWTAGAALIFSSTMRALCCQPLRKIAASTIGVRP